MAISGGKIDYSVLDGEYEDSKKERLENHEERQRHRIEHQVGNVKRLMSEEWGRELMWDVLIDTASLKLNPYTRNADTYYILGLQKQARQCTEVLKELDLSLYHKMELEANNRKKREEHE